MALALLIPAAGRAVAASLAAPETIAALRPQLAELRTVGYAILPAELIAPEQAAAILAELRSPEAAALPRQFRGANEQAWVVARHGETPAAIAQAASLVRELAAFAVAALPNEALEPTASLEARLSRSGLAGNPSSRKVHADGGYLTTTVSIHGPGTVLYVVRGDGRYEPRPVPTRSIVLLTNPERESAVGAPTTLHGTPDEESVDRALLVARHRSLRAAAPRNVAGFGKFETAQGRADREAARINRLLRDGR